MSFEFLTALRNRSRLRLEPANSPASFQEAHAKSSWRLTPFGPIQCHVAGEGSPILIAPGLWGGSDLMVPTIALLTKSFRVHWFDWPGDRGLVESASLRNVFRPQTILEEAVRTSGERNLAILGHSFGAFVALNAMAQGSFPQVSRFIIAGAGLCESHRPIDTFLRNLRNRKRLESADPIVAALAKTALGGIHEGSPAYRHAIAAISRTSPASLDRRLSWIADAKPTCSGSELSCPVSLLAGERDCVVPMHSQLRLAESIGADVSVIPSAGHLGMTTHPAIYAQAIARLVRQGNESSRRKVASE